MRKADPNSLGFENFLFLALPPKLRWSWYGTYTKGTWHSMSERAARLVGAVSDVDAFALYLAIFTGDWRLGTHKTGSR